MSDPISAALTAGVAHGDLPGAVACAAVAGGEICRVASGMADAAGTTPMQPDTLFFIASMTKLVTHVAIMQLIEQGLLSLDDRADRFVPALADRQVLEGFTDAGTPILRPARTPITLRHLLGYTSGFAYPYWHPDIKRYTEWAGLPDSVSYRLQSLDLPLVADPGARWHYGIGSEFLGLIVERLSGQPLDRHVRTHILDPLGMHDTFYTVPPGDHHRIAALHMRLADGTLSPIAMTLPPEPEFHPGGVGLFSTAPDYLRLTRMLLGGGTLDARRVLRQQTVAAMAEDLLNGAPMEMPRSCDPFWTRDIDLFAPQRTLWSAGLLMNTENLATGRSAFSLSWGGACNTFYWIDRTRGVTGVFMTSVVPFCDPRALQAFTAFETSVYAML